MDGNIYVGVQSHTRQDRRCVSRQLSSSLLMVVAQGGGGGGGLRYISDGDVRSPFLGLKFAI